MKALRDKAITGLFWSFSQQFGTQITVFVISIILARLLEPSEFGLIGMIAILISIGNVLVDSGMGSSLIRTPSPDDLDYSTVFYINIGIGISIYLLVFFSAPLVALFYEQPILTLIIRIYSLSFIVSSFSIVQSTKLNKELRFKTQMLVNIPSLILAGSVGLVLAYQGFGVWTLVFMNIARSVIGTLILWLVSDWKPQLVFDIERLKIHFGFGSKVLGAQLVNMVFLNSSSIIIGKFFSPTQLGFYTRATSLKQLPVDNITSAINKVTYPLFSSIQDDSKKFNRFNGRVLIQTMFWLSPLMTTLIVIAEPLVQLLLTSKWLPSVPYFQILCLVGIINPWHKTNLNILKVLGYSSLFFKLEMVYNLLILFALLLLIPFGIIGLVWGQLFAILISLFLNISFGGKLIGYNLSIQLRDIIPILSLCLVSGLVGFMLFNSLGKMELGNWSIITIVSFVIFTIYIFFGWLLNLSALFEIRSIIKSMIK